MAAGFIAESGFSERGTHFFWGELGSSERGNFGSEPVS